MRMSRQLVCGFTALGLTLSAGAALAAPCPPGVLAAVKTNQLHLYFPPAVDATFPGWPGGLTTGAISPLQPFNVADLDPTIGTTAQLRNSVFNFVVDDYCEFNVQVNQSTTAPVPTMPRWQIVGVGTDSAEVGAGNILFGIAQAVDTNDSDPQDYARVFSKSFLDACGGPGGALTGANSTLTRWATAIGETTAHEAAHNYGAAHGHSAPRPTEDTVNWHIMATGSTGLTCSLRASRNRHFSDTEYEILGYNIGLNIKTLHNWDFINTNNVPARCMRINLLSNLNSLNIGWWYGFPGSASPWKNPTVTYTGNSQMFQGTSYFVHHLDFSVAETWTGPVPGEVLPLAPFHTGATFTGSPTVIVFDVEMFSNNTCTGTPLPLAPRLAGYDTGDTHLGSGDFRLNFFNTNAAAGALRLSEVQVFRSPRMIDINSMMAAARPVDIHGAEVELTPVATFRDIELRDRVSLPIGNLTQARSVDIRYTDEDCPEGGVGPLAPADAESEVKYCHRGNALSLFPGTYTYVIATVVDPQARYWDAKKEDFVTGPQQNIIYYQLAGIVPDFNHNGVDDLLDIRNGTSRDQDKNGVPDEVKPEANGGEAQIVKQ